MKAEAKLQKWFSKTEVAARYNVCPRTVERWVATGLFPAGILFNKRWRWPIAAVEQHERGLIGGGADRRAQGEARAAAEAAAVTSA